MSAWAAIAAKDTAATTSLGNGILHGISPGALDGFAVGTMLTGLCFLVIVAPRALRQTRLSARPAVWPSFIRGLRVQRDYYAAPGDTYSLAADTYSLAAESEMIFAAAPVADAPEATAGPEATETAPEATETAPEATETAPAEYAAAEPQPVETASAEDFTAAEPVTALAASPDFCGYAGADPYAVETAADPGAAPLLVSSEDDIVAAAGEQARPEGGRGYRSKHRLTDHEPAERRGEGRRGAPKHAAPSNRFGSRMSGKLTLFPLVVARG
jgi:hypothetical protein